MEGKQFIVLGVSDVWNMLLKVLCDGHVFLDALKVLCDGHIFLDAYDTL